MQPAVRLGLSVGAHVGDDLAERIEAERGGPRALHRHGGPQAPGAPLKLDVLEALATAGAFGCFRCRRGRPLDRRRALWGAGAVAQTGADRLAGIVTGVHAPTLPGMTDHEEAVADLWATGVAPDGHPTRFVRPALDALGVVPAAGLLEVDDGAEGAGRRGGHPPPAPGHRVGAPPSSTSRTRPA